MHRDDGEGVRTRNVKLCVNCRSTFDSAAWRCPTCAFEPQRCGDILSFLRSAVGDPWPPEELARVAAAQDGHFWYDARSRLIAWALARYFPGVRDLLEVGCGAGAVLASLRRQRPAVRLCGGDLSLVALAYARARVPDAQLFQMDASALPFAAEFDVVGAWDSLEHVADDETVLAEMFRATRPGGGAIIAAPQHPWLWSQADEWAGHVRRYTASELLRKVRRAGFDVVRTTSFVSLLLPMLAVSRLLQHLCGRRYRIEAELLRPGRLVNFTFGWLLAADARLIAAGASLPVGGSLLVVARRPWPDATKAAASAAPGWDNETVR